MKTLFFFISLSVPSFALAAFDYKAFEKEVGDYLYETLSLGNGDSRTTSYSNLDVAAELKAIRDEQASKDPKEDCIFYPVAGISKNLDNISNNSEANDPGMVTLLSKARKAGAIKQIIGQIWDEYSGDSEYCSIYRFKIYLKNGTYLYLSYEHTD